MSAVLGLGLAIPGAILLGVLIYLGQIATGVLLTNLALVLLTLAFTLLLVQSIVGLNERQERRRKAQYPLSHIRTLVRDVEDRVVREYAKYFRDDDLVHSLTARDYSNPAAAADAIEEAVNQLARPLNSTDVVHMVDDIQSKLAEIVDELHEAAPNLDEGDLAQLRASVTDMRTAFGPVQGVGNSIDEAGGVTAKPELAPADPMNLIAQFLWATVMASRELSNVSPHQS